MVRTDVEGVEGQPFGLDLGSFGDLPAHADEDVLDPLGDQADRGSGTEPLVRARDGQVEGLLDEDPLSAFGLQLGLAGLEGLRHLSAGLADALAGLGLGARRERSDLAVGERQGAFVPLVRTADPLEFVEGRGTRSLGLVATQAADAIAESAK